MNAKNTTIKQSIFLEGKKIYLRALVEEDCNGDYINWFNNPEVCKYNSHHTFPYQKYHGLEYVRQIRDSQTDLVLAIEEKKSKLHIGNVSLQQINYISRNAEFAIIIGNKNFWGKGFSKMAAELIITHGFEVLNLHRIYCATSTDNIPMQKLAKYLGMKEEGVRREAMYKKGKYFNFIEFGLMKNEYLNAV